MAAPILESLLKKQINYNVLWHFLLLNKKVEKFQLCLKTVVSLFPFSSVWHSSLKLSDHLCKYHLNSLLHIILGANPFLVYELILYLPTLNSFSFKVNEKSVYNFWLLEIPQTP